MKVRLAALEDAHAPTVVRFLRDPVIRDNLGLRESPTLARTRELVAASKEGTRTCGRAILVDGKHVGVVVLDRFDRGVGAARLHIYIGAAAARGRGAGKKALALALDLAFGPLALHKVWLTVHARNSIALAAYTAVGFQVEGVHRDEFLLGGERVNAIHMGILAPEWRSRSA